MNAMQTLSLRISDEDYHWLTSSDAVPGKTPSEKLRALIAHRRAQETGVLDNEACAAWLRGLAAPLTDSVAAYERVSRTHSEALAAIAEWTPRLMALLISGRVSDNAQENATKDVTELEARLLQPAFRLLSTLLRMGMTSYPALYDTQALKTYFPEILEIAGIILSRTERELHHE